MRIGKESDGRHTPGRPTGWWALVLLLLSGCSSGLPHQTISLQPPADIHVERAATKAGPVIGLARAVDRRSSPQKLGGEFYLYTYKQFETVSTNDSVADYLTGALLSQLLTSGFQVRLGKLQEKEYPVVRSEVKGVELTLSGEEEKRWARGQIVMIVSYAAADGRRLWSQEFRAEKYRIVDDSEDLDEAFSQNLLGETAALLATEVATRVALSNLQQATCAIDPALANSGASQREILVRALEENYRKLLFAEYEDLLARDYAIRHDRFVRKQIKKELEFTAMLNTVTMVLSAGMGAGMGTGSTTSMNQANLQQAQFNQAQLDSLIAKQYGLNGQEAGLHGGPGLVVHADDILEGMAKFGCM